MSKLFTKEELIYYNEAMLGRGVPVEEDGKGYNKGDYGACKDISHGASDAQLAVLAKRLVKYCNTQLGLEKEDMTATHEHFLELAGDNQAYQGISLDVKENGYTGLVFKYNEHFVKVIQAQKVRQYDPRTHMWLVPNSQVIKVLHKLEEVGADIKNALDYASTNEKIKTSVDEKIEVLTKFQGGKAHLKFSFNNDVIESIKKIPTRDRQYNTERKFWTIHPKHLEALKLRLRDVATFKQVQE